jgi:hypothetical protein
VNKRVISVGIWIPGTADEYSDFQSDRSLLDADIIIFAPNLESYQILDRYRGKARLTDEHSARLSSDVAHWGRELRIALEAGKTVFLFALGADEVYVATGEKQYSGTGRNARTTGIVTLLDPYSSLPMLNLESTIHRRLGDRIKTTKHIGILASYWHEFGPFTSYQLYLEKPIGIPALVTQVGDKMVGGLIRFKNLRGSIVLLPPPSFDDLVKDRQKQQREGSESSATRTPNQNKAARERAQVSIGAQFIGKLIEIDKAVRAGSERTPAPDWVTVRNTFSKEKSPFRNKSLSERERLLSYEN